MKLLEQNYELVPLEQLSEHPMNANRSDVEALNSSVETTGFYGAVLAQRSSGFVLAGNHRLQVARAQEAAQLPVIWLDVDDAQARRILVSDNRITRLGHDDDEALARLLEDIASEGTLEGTGYEDDDLAALLEQLGTSDEPGALQDPELENPLDELQARWDTAFGQLWTLPSLKSPGHSHRILCGDSTRLEDVLRVLEGQTPQMIFSDPPYGISIVNKDGTLGNGTNYKPVHGDEDTTIALTSVKMLLERYPKAVQVWWGGNYYTEALPPSMGWIVWDKQNDAISFADFELAWTNQHRAGRFFRHMWSGAVRASERDTKRVHPTQKPVALAAWCFEEMGTHHDLILDPFLGSGPSLLAAEQTGRIVCGLEFDPQYVAAILERASTLGLKPELVV